MPVMRTGSGAGSHVNTATDDLDLMSQVRDFLTTANELTTPDGTGNTGNGTMSTPTADDDAETETWTVECTDASTPGSEVWSVTGSVSGAQDDATTGVAYDDIVQFTISAGGVGFIVGDTFTFDVEQIMGAAVWTEEANTTSGFTVDGEVYFTAPGAGGIAETGINWSRTSSVPGDRYNWQLNVSTGYDSGSLWGQQPGCVPASNGVPCLLLWHGTINFVCVADAFRMVLVCYASGKPTQSCYLGRFDALGSPSQYAAPFFAGACHYDETVNYADTGDDHIYFGNSKSTSQTAESHAHVRSPGGTWGRLRSGRASTIFTQNTTHALLHPTCFLPTASRVIHAYGPKYLVRPLHVYLHTAADGDASRIGNCSIVGELRGVGYISGYGLSTGSTINSEAYFIFNDTTRTDLVDYLALELA